MNQHTLQVLEYDLIRERVASEAASTLGIERAVDMVPSVDYAYIQARLDETSEARRLLSSRGTVPFGGITDIRGVLRQAQIGGVLDAASLVDIASTVAAARRLKLFLAKGGRELFPLIIEISEIIGIFTAIEDGVERSIGPGGHILDSASTELSRIRSRRRTAEQRIQDKLNGIVNGPQRSLLQDPVVVQRNDRWCIPVKADYRNALGGIVHDTSSSGATLFVEPAAVVEIGNEIRELIVQEAQEVYRILAKLTDLVRQSESQLFTTVNALGTLDFIFARAKYADRLDAVEPSISTGGMTRLLSARHPIIDPAVVVATDVTVGSSVNQILIITGPNTGGKTVTLKTLGLLTLMAQSGLHVPATRAEVSVFERVFADIGDEQSIEQSLSTFSSHITRIAEILREVNDRSLVLFDEVGAGTDPEEGSALARAILEFIRIRGARAIVTSHYGELKAYAFSTPGVQNASVEFDEESLRPTYRLLQGIPGSSHAFTIASRLGLPDEVLAIAGTSEERADTSFETIRALENARRTALVDANAAEEARREAEEFRRRAERELTEYETLRREIRQKALEEARTLIRRTQEKASNILADIRRNDARQVDAEYARDQIGLIGSDLEDEIEDLLQLPEQPEAAEMDLGRPLREGDRVRVTTLNLAGTLLSDVDSEGKVPVQVGALRVLVPVSALRSLAPTKSKPQVVLAGLRNNLATPAETAADVPQQITLLGQRAEEAVANVDQYLDEAQSAGLRRVRIVHGKGTGALRKAIHERLRSNRLVSDFAVAESAEGGSGATIVELMEE
jgi:DNA mismatch repair protein MutS2